MSNKIVLFQWLSAWKEIYVVVFHPHPPKKSLVLNYMYSLWKDYSLIIYGNIGLICVYLLHRRGKL